MTGHTLRSKPIIVAIVAVFYCLTTGIIFGTTSQHAIYLPLTLAPWMAFAACVWRASRSPRQSLSAWSMLSSGILLWALGMSLAAWEDTSGYISSNVAFFSDLLYLLYGVPILLVITYPAESEIAPFFLWLDTIQALMTGCVIYLALFDVMPFGDQPFQQLSQSRLIFAYDMENLSLAVLAGLRLLAGSHDRDRMRLLRLLFSFLVLYLLAATAYNHQFSRLNGIMGLYDLLPPTPFLFLGAVVLWPRMPTSAPRQAAHRSFAVWIDNISPAFYTFSLVAIGLTQIRAHFIIGVAAIVVAMLIYAIRMAMLQNRYARAQISLRKALDQLETLSLTDPLTGIPNRRAFDKALDAEWRRAYRLQRPLSLLLIDIDYFKKLNDTYGHTTGDDCLIRVARALHESLPRSGDMAARYGGEEFAAVLAATNTDGAQLVATRMCDAIRQLAIPNQTPIGATVSLSVGIASCEPARGGSISLLIETADRALYEAKRKGRNQVCSLDSHSGSDTMTSTLQA